MNRRYLNYFLLLICSMACFGFVNKEDDPIKILLSKLEKYHTTHPVEKIHLHTDKPYYTLGDSIWFKAYVVNGEANQLSGLSKIVYVDLINEKDSIKKSLRLPLISGLAWGDFELSDSLTEGNYRLRAYTTWMRNFGEEFYFDKTIQIGNSLTNPIVSNVIYNFSKTGIKENVTAHITYQDIDGKPLANKEVTYTVQLDFRNIASGKGSTDADGKLNITFTNNQPFVLKSGRIITKIKLNEQTQANKVFPVKATSAETDLQFFPEGGQLVNGLYSRVGFKAVGADGLGRNVEGYVVDKDNKQVIDFKSEHAGMGLFNLIPEPGNNYKAVITFNDGSEKRYDLPKAAEQGYVLSVNNSSPSNIYIRANASEGLSNQGEYTLVAQNNGVVYFVSKKKFEGGAFTGSVPRKRFPPGILQLTLFSADNKPLAERLIFNRPKPVSATITTNKSSYTKREKVDLSFDVLDTAAQGLQGNFSVAVVNESMVAFDDNNETTILSNLLLSADLKGYVEKPNYYFTEPDYTKDKHLDNLMLTQGWRRYNWTTLLNTAPAALNYAPERSISIAGRVSTPSGKPVIRGKVTLLPTRGGSVILDTLTGPDGRFAFPDLEFRDSTTFVVQARDEKGKKNVYIDLDELAPQLVTKNKNAAELEVNVNQNLLSYLRSRASDFSLMRKNGLLRKSIMLAEVKVASKRQLVTHSGNLAGPGHADAVIGQDVLKNCFNMIQCIQGMIAGLVIENGIAYLARNVSFSGRVPMLLIVDGINFEPEFLSTINPQEVETIEILKNAGTTAIYGMRGGGGVLIINTKRGERNLSYRSMSPGIASFKPQALYSSRTFYSPAYPDPAKKNEDSLPDLRNTIFWTPNILSDSTGRASLSFYTADAAAVYKVTIEGLGFDGTLVRKVFRFNVN